jgi:RHS repeat-associated protein
MNRKNGPAAYDALGNVTNDGVGHTYVWDAENRLSSVNGYAYVYDAFGRRVKGPSGEVLYDLSGHAVAWLDAGTGGWNIGELYADARHVATYSNGTTNFLHNDWLGTKRVMTSVTGATSETCTALSFGDGNNCAGTDWSYNNFTDDPHDGESNTEHTWFRQLSTTQGRWLSPDPAGLAAVDPTNPQSWNRYAYVMNQPTTLIDPFGLCGLGTYSYIDADGNFVFGTTVNSLSCLSSGGVTIRRVPLRDDGSGGVGGGGDDTHNAANNSTGFLSKLNTCVVNNAKTYSIGGSANLIANMQLPGSGLASNSITDTYLLLSGQDGQLSSIWDATKAGFQWAAAASPPIMTNGPYSFTTISPAHGSPQAILGNGTNYQGFWASAKRLLKSGAQLKLAADAGFTGALILNCSLGQIQ